MARNDVALLCHAARVVLNLSEALKLGEKRPNAPPFLYVFTTSFFLPNIVGVTSAAEQSGLPTLRARVGPFVSTHYRSLAPHLPVHSCAFVTE